MNKKLEFLIIALIFISTISCSAQKKQLLHFIPDGYVLFEEIEGDLNEDGLKDRVLIVKNTRKENIVKNPSGDKVDRSRRGVIVLINRENEYEVAVENLDCFYSENEDGGNYYPPELSVYIENGNLNFHYGHGRYGHWKYIFSYDESDLRLTGYESSTSRGPVVNYRTSINFISGEKITSENINEDAEGGEEVFEDTRHEIETDKMIKLSEIGKFDELDMSVY